MGVQGQATVEAAVLLPVLFVCLLALLQPAILLYDRLVMEAAAADACRMLVTQAPSQGIPDEVYREDVIRHLGAIPPQDSFHVHEGGCSWQIELDGNEASASVSVTIRNQVRPLPLFDQGFALAGMTNGAGNVEITVTRTMPAQPEWAAGRLP